MKTMKKELLAMKANKEDVEEQMNKLRSHYEEQLAIVDKHSKSTIHCVTKLTLKKFPVLLS